MEKDETILLQKQNLHKILVYSHGMQFVLFLFAVFLDAMFNIKVFSNFNFIFAVIGVIFLIKGSVLIFWAQHSSHHLHNENITKESFSRGPYRYVKNPTNYGIFFTILGFGIIANSFFVILFAFISSMIAKFFFLNREKEILIAKYGAPYIEYRKSVKF